MLLLGGESWSRTKCRLWALFGSYRMGRECRELVCVLSHGFIVRCPTVGRPPQRFYCYCLAGMRGIEPLCL